MRVMIDPAIETLARAGLDLEHRFDARAVARELELPAIAGDLGIVVATTRAVWPTFLAERREEDHPLDRYVERTIESAFEGVPTARWYFAHRRYGERFLPMQRIAAAAGMGTLAETHLLVHRDYGPWIGLRAVIVVDGVAPPLRTDREPVCTCSAPCRDAMSRALASNDWRDWLAVRDACPVGREHRYSDAQIAYHYTGDVKFLDES